MGGASDDEKAYTQSGGRTIKLGHNVSELEAILPKENPATGAKVVAGFRPLRSEGGQVPGVASPPRRRGRFVAAMPHRDRRAALWQAPARQSAAAGRGAWMIPASVPVQMFA
jgi:hypothetical protein